MYKHKLCYVTYLFLMTSLYFTLYKEVIVKEGTYMFADLSPYKALNGTNVLQTAEV